MTYAAVQRQSDYECKVFRFRDEVLLDPRCVESAPSPSGKLEHWQAGFEWFSVYWWLK